MLSIWNGLYVDWKSNMRILFFFCFKRSRVCILVFAGFRGPFKKQRRASSNVKRKFIFHSDSWSLKKGSKKGIGTQCGNIEIFLSFRFYVKSTLENLEVLKTAFFANLGALKMFNLVDFSLQNVQKFIYLNQISEPLNVFWQF